MCLYVCVLLSALIHSFIYSTCIYSLGKNVFDVEGRLGDQITRDMLGNSEESPVIGLQDKGSSDATQGNARK